MEIMIIFGIIFIVLVVASIAKSMREDKIEEFKKQIEQDLKILDIKDSIFSETNFSDGKEDYCLAISENKIFIVSVDYNENIVKVKEYLYEDILQVEIIEDGSTISKTETSSQVGRAILGGVLFGGVGAIIGGLSGTSTTAKTVESLLLRIIVNNTEEPVSFIKFIMGTCERSSKKYNIAKNNVQKWYAIMEVAIHRAKQSITVDNFQFEDNNSTIKKCPFCAEDIKKEAIVCKYCGRDLPNIIGLNKQGAK